MPNQHPPHVTALLALLGTALGVNVAAAVDPERLIPDPAAASQESLPLKVESRPSYLRDEKIAPQLEMRQHKIESPQHKIETRQMKLESDQFKPGVEGQIPRERLPAPRLP